MSLLWPRLDRGVASRLFSEILRGSFPDPASSHDMQIFSEVGVRVRENEIRTFGDDVRDCATHYGFGDDEPLEESAASAFDKAVTPLLCNHLNLAWSEASSGEVWSFIALVVLPDVTKWRWPHSANEQHWVGVDLTRHQWGRLWWRGTVFRGHEEILEQLLESEIDQIMSRRTIGGKTAYATALAEAYLNSPTRTLDGTRLSRRALLRDLLKRARRAPAFIDVMALDDKTMKKFVERLVEDSVEAFTDKP